MIAIAIWLAQHLMLPLTDREIPVVADEFVDPEFGTGAVKVTPAHDPNDYEMGVRHDLAQIAVIDAHAKMTEAAGAEFAGLDRYKAREKVVENLKSWVYSRRLLTTSSPSQSVNAAKR